MKIVKLKNNIVIEIIPEYALPVEQWYGADFAAHCIEAPDDAEQGMIYNGETFTAPDPPAETDTITMDDLAEQVFDLEVRTTMIEQGVN